MNKQTKTTGKSQLAADLHSQFPAAEADSILTFASQLSKSTPRPLRSSRAKQAGWQVLQENMESVPQSRNWLFTWKLALIPALLLVALLGMSWISHSAEPGDFSYSFKRATESVQLTFAFSDQKKADICSMLMKRRANELALLPGGTSNTTIVSELSTAIRDEAVEYNEYAQNSGNNRAVLATQRTRDARYVVDALKSAQANQTDQKSQQAITKTLIAMNQIISES